MIDRVHQQGSVGGNQWGNRRQSTQTIPFTPPSPKTDRQAQNCANCGQLFDADTKFCTKCGTQLRLNSSRFAAWVKARPALWRRVSAEFLDCLLPMMFILFGAVLFAHVGLKYYFWLSVIGLFAWHVLRDSSPRRRSFGKSRLGLRVVAASGREPCRRWRTILRRLLPAIAQSALYLGFAKLGADWTDWDTLRLAIEWPWIKFAQSSSFTPAMVFVPLCYNLLSLAAVQVSAEGRRIEDYLTGTRVILESAYARDRKRCSRCGEMILKLLIYCPGCGERNAPTIKVREGD